MTQFTSTERTEMLNLIDTRPARMLAAGRVTVTGTSKVTGQHITIRVKCLKRNDTDTKWVNSNIEDAKLICLDVPPAGDEWYGDKVGKVTRSKGFVADPKADAARVFVARNVLAWVTGGETHKDLDLVEESRCGRCGRQLTDPVSIARGIGPECYGMETGSQHQVKVTAPQAPGLDAGVAA